MTLLSTRMCPGEYCHEGHYPRYTNISLVQYRPYCYFVSSYMYFNQLS